jgi:hypothetical protein
MSGAFADVTAMPPDPAHPGKHIDPATGIWPVSEWGSECGRGFVSDERFQRGNEKVIKRKARKRRPICAGTGEL